MVKYRFYIDESGDHTYKHLDNLDTRYLGLTGILIERKYYQTHAQPELEALKQRIFKYDPDNPPILVRNLIKHRKKWFYVLQDEKLNEQWETELLSYIGSLVPHATVYTVVIDKKSHIDVLPYGDAKSPAARDFGHGAASREEDLSVWGTCWRPVPQAPWGAFS